MQRALLMSILFLTIIVPTAFSKDPRPARGLRRTVIVMCALIVVWGYSCRTFYYSLGD